MAGYTKEEREKRKAFKAKMAIIKSKLPPNYSQMIMDYRLGTTGLVERKRVSRSLVAIVFSHSYAQHLENPNYLPLLEELADKYDFFMQIYN